MSGLSEPAGWLHLDWVLIVVGAWLLVGAVGVSGGDSAQDQQAVDAGVLAFGGS